MITALELLKLELKSAHDIFEQTASDIADEHVQLDPGGKAFPLGATYAHLVFSEDVILHQMIMGGKTPLCEGEFKDKTGVSTPMPPMDENWEKANHEWSKSVQIDMPKMREYAKAVFAATDAYINSLTDEDLEKEVDLGSWGKKQVHELLSGFIIAHANQLTGELAALKGVHGAKGYPF
jgi:hypothetical protein